MGFARSSAARVTDQRQIRNRQYKYVWNSFDYDELHDVVNDPQETFNLRGDPTYSQVERDLIGRLWRWAVDTDGIIMSEYPMNGNLRIGPGVVSGRRGDE